MNRDETIDFLAREQRIIDLKHVLSTSEGRRFIWRLLEESRVFQISFVAGYTDSTIFNEGTRNFGLYLMNEIQREAPESFLLMQREAVEYERNNKKEVQTRDGEYDPHH